MNDDRELLELAAKAAGMSLSWHDWGDFGLQPMASKLGDVCAGPTTWNPLTDDGDALRLAVKLQLTVCNDHVSSGATYCTRGENEDFPTVYSGFECDGPVADHVIPEDYAATRRAIVRAAAEIGKSIP